MKIKHLIIVSLILAVLAIGAVSASEDVTDDLAVEDDGVDIEEAPVDEVISTDESQDSLELNKTDFDISYYASADSLYDTAVDIDINTNDEGDYLTTGTFYGHVNGTLVRSSSSNGIYWDFDDLGIYSSGTYHIVVNFTSTTNENLTLADFNAVVNLSDGGDDDDDDYDRSANIYSYIDIKNPKDTIGYVYDEFYLNGTVTVTINGKQYYSKKFSEADKKDEIELTTADLNIGNFAYGDYKVNITYVTNNGDRYSDEDTVKFTTVPEVFWPYSMSVGEDTGLIIKGDSGVSGTVTIFNAVEKNVTDEDDPESYYTTYEKGSVFATAKITDGYARISFSKLSEGHHRFFLEYAFGNYIVNGSDYDDEGPGYKNVYVYKNSPGFSSTVSASTITVGNTISVNFKGNVSDETVYYQIDGKEYKSARVTGSDSEIISGLSVGTHYITVKFDGDEDKFYSYTHVITVKDKSTPVKKDTVKLTLAKVKVKKSAKKLVIVYYQKIFKYNE